MSLLLRALKQVESANRPSPTNPPSPDWIEPPQLAYAARPPHPSGVRPFIFVLAALLGAAIAYAGYVYWMLAHETPAPQPLRPAPPPAIPAALAAHGAAPDPLPPAPAVSPERTSESPTPEHSAERHAAPPVLLAPPASAPPAKSRATLPTQAPVPDRPQMPASAQAAVRVRADAPPALLTAAQRALEAGALEDAEQRYRAAQAAGAEVPALLGLAAIARLRGRDPEADRLYREVLQLDPRNPIAQAAVIESRLDPSAPGASPVEAESRLKTLIARAPNAALYQTLGHLLASQSRWSEAQAAYFEAYRLAPTQADYAFNLAVSLDHLGQHAAAADYYARALALTGPARFDRNAASRRLAELEPLR